MTVDASIKAYLIQEDKKAMSQGAMIGDWSISVQSVKTIPTKDQTGGLGRPNGSEVARYAVSLRMNSINQDDGLWGVAQVYVWLRKSDEVLLFHRDDMTAALDTWSYASDERYDGYTGQLDQIIVAAAKSVWEAANP